MVGHVAWGGWPCVTQGLACVTETAETAETADRYMRFWAPTKETQPKSTKRNPNFVRTLAVPWVLRRRNAGAARGGSTRKDAPGLSPRAAGHGAIFGPFLAVFRPFFCIFAIFYRAACIVSLSQSDALHALHALHDRYMTVTCVTPGVVGPHPPKWGLAPFVHRG